MIKMIKTRSQLTCSQLKEMKENFLGSIFDLAERESDRRAVFLAEALGFSPIAHTTSAFEFLVSKKADY